MASRTACRICSLEGKWWSTAGLLTPTASGSAARGVTIGSANAYQMVRARARRSRRLDGSAQRRSTSGSGRWPRRPLLHPQRLRRLVVGEEIAEARPVDQRGEGPLVGLVGHLAVNELDDLLAPQLALALDQGAHHL